MIPNSRATRLSWLKSLSRARPGPGVLDLDGDLAAVLPDRAVYLADGRRRPGRVVELRERLPPGRAEVPGEDLVHGPRGQRRGRLLQLGQRGPVRAGDLRRQGRLENGQRLAELHRSALELAQDAENLLGGALLDLGGDDLGRPATEPLAQAERGPASQAGGEGGQFRGPGHGTSGEIVHPSILSQDAERLLQRHCGWGSQLCRRHCQSGSTSSSVPLITAGAGAARSRKASACAVAWAATAAASTAAHAAGRGRPAADLGEDERPGRVTVGPGHVHAAQARRPGWDDQGSDHADSFRGGHGQVRDARGHQGAG